MYNCRVLVTSTTSIFVLASVSTIGDSSATNTDTLFSALPTRRWSNTSRRMRRDPHERTFTRAAKRRSVFSSRVARSLSLHDRRSLLTTTSTGALVGLYYLLASFVRARVCVFIRVYWGGEVSRLQHVAGLNLITEPAPYFAAAVRSNRSYLESI